MEDHGEVDDYTNWGPDQPDGGLAQNCAFKDKDMEFKWNDLDCLISEGIHALCQIQ